MYRFLILHVVKSCFAINLNVFLQLIELMGICREQDWPLQYNDLFV